MAASAPDPPLDRESYDLPERSAGQALSAWIRPFAVHLALDEDSTQLQATVPGVIPFVTG